MSDTNEQPNMGSASGSQSPTKKEAAVPAVTFTEKEEAVLKVAWSCLKSGAPDIDMVKLQKAGGFNTQKTCQNTWGVIKKKLMSMAPPASAEGAAGGDEGAGTPKPKATPKKRAAAKKDANDDDEAETGSPKKKARTPAKKAANDDEETGSPKKKARTPAKKTKAALKKEEEAAAVKSEEGEAEEDGQVKEEET